jgi:hypothetical protein
MSLISLPEAHSFSTGIEVEGFVKSMGKGAEIWIDYLQDYRRVCNANLTDGKGNMINVAFWGQDILKVRNNLKIRITDAKWDDTKKVLYKTKIGEIIALEFNPNLIFNDMEKFKKYRTDVKSIKQYYDYVKSSKSDVYLTMDKLDYLKIIDEFVTLECYKKRMTRRNSAISSAIFNLHQKVTLTPVKIRQTLALFGIQLEIGTILDISTEWDKKRFSINSSKINHHRSIGINVQNNHKIQQMECSSDIIPEALTIEEETRDDASDGPLCEGNSLEFYRKYKGYSGV